ncbi:MAG: NAD(P)-dependent glycerol-1-phosphate dehydrogenase [Candidatus Hecatellales archaeon]|nr:MAG: NAD(P)-dependent glycerol-1-phosphate dehydrogenase [Candidatus Hecatellales archaeon]
MHSMELPRRVVVGFNILNVVGRLCLELGIKGRILVVSGPKTHHVAGGVVVDSLEEAGLEVSSLKVEEASRETVEETVRALKAEGATAAIGVGGGKVIDVAKLASARAGIPFLSCPTAASHDGIASPQASIQDSRGPISIRAQSPLAIIADIDVILKAPYRLMASGCGDIIAKFTAVRDWWLAHQLRGEYYGDYAANLALMSARLVARNARLVREGSEEGARTVVEALISCGVAMSIAGSSRPCSGSEHLFSHALERVAPGKALHGERCGVGTIMMGYLHKLRWKRIRAVLKMVGAPTTASELGVESEEVVNALTEAHRIRPERYTILGEKGLTRDSALKLAKETGVI